MIGIDPRAHFVVQILYNLKNQMLNGQSPFTPFIGKEDLFRLWHQKMKLLSQQEQIGDDLELIGVSIGLCNKNFLLRDKFFSICNILKTQGYIIEIKKPGPNGLYRSCRVNVMITKKGEMLFNGRKKK